MTMRIDPKLAHRVRLLALDVDGVLTDNGIWVGPIAGQRVELKRFDIQDGLGLVLLRTAGIPVIWLSGRHSEATELRAREPALSEQLHGLLRPFEPAHAEMRADDVQRAAAVRRVERCARPDRAARLRVR